MVSDQKITLRLGVSLTHFFSVVYSVVFHICAFTGKYAMLIPPLRGDAYRPRSRTLPLLSKRSGHQRW